MDLSQMSKLSQMMSKAFYHSCGRDVGTFNGIPAYYVELDLHCAALCAYIESGSDGKNVLAWTIAEDGGYVSDGNGGWVLWRDTQPGFVSKY